MVNDEDDGPDRQVKSDECGQDNFHALPSSDASDGVVILYSPLASFANPSRINILAKLVPVVPAFLAV